MPRARHLPSKYQDGMVKVNLTLEYSRCRRFSAKDATQRNYWFVFKQNGPPASTDELIENRSSTEDQGGIIRSRPTLNRHRRLKFQDPRNEMTKTRHNNNMPVFRSYSCIGFITLQPFNFGSKTLDVEPSALA
ncbi:hypothetical protein EVAR_38818_1 [Eumeta japonica]|uniref:Uncharacterized protein n=1 Tax=Eumeta variegata TaxID=151549 RepID=A0A4C1XQP6_EUMVA|nr:hypothetical protein EVAR_38818_1 [Eumeta japonica]